MKPHFLACSFAVAASALGFGCAIDPSGPSEPATALFNGSSDDSAGVSVTLAPHGERHFRFDCAQRCDVELALEVAVRDTTGPAPVLHLYVTRPDGFTRHEFSSAGASTLSYPQLPAGTYEVALLGLDDEIDVAMRASWIEGGAQVPGGSASLTMVEQVDGRDARATMLFTCEEAAGCDLEAWAALAEASSGAATVESDLAFGRVGATITDVAGWSRALDFAPAGSGTFRLATVRELPRGEHRVSLQIAGPASAEVLSLIAAFDWAPSRPATTLAQRVAAYVAARQRAFGCAEGLEGRDERAAADELAMRSASGEGEDPYREASATLTRLWTGREAPFVTSVEMFAPSTGMAIHAIDADSSVRDRIAACDRYGVGHAVDAAGRSHLAFAFTPDGR